MAGRKARAYTQGELNLISAKVCFPKITVGRPHAKKNAAPLPAPHPFRMTIPLQVPSLRVSIEENRIPLFLITL
jgi:hypothetical protein